MVAQTTTEDLAERMLLALEATQKVINSRATQVTPPPPVIDASPEPLPDHPVRSPRTPSIGSEDFEKEAPAVGTGAKGLLSSDLSNDNNTRFL